MTEQNRYIWLRNISLLSICGYLCYSLFPFPPITWRLLLLGTAFLVVVPNFSILTRIEKTIIAFWALNLIYFFVSYFGFVSPSTTLIGNISVSLLSIPLFMTLGRKGVMTSSFYLVVALALVLSSLVYYKAMEAQYIAKLLGDDTTNNASVAFLCIMPIIFILKNRYLSYGVLLVSVYFILDAAKRGNIVCAIPVLLLFFIYNFRNKQIHVYEKIIFLIFFFFAVSWGFEQFEQNEYLQVRMEQTIEGNSSGRDRIYENAWKVYSESQSMKNIILGYGFQATYYNEQIGNYAHNDWLELLVDNGIVGALLYLYIFIQLFKITRSEEDIQKRYLLISVVAIWFLKSTFSMSFTGETTFILFLFFGYVTHDDDALEEIHMESYPNEN